MSETTKEKRDLRFVPPEDMTPAERSKWEKDFKAAMESGTPQSDEFFADRRKKQIGVGLNTAGQVIRKPE